jgi:hypothetical protein
MGPDGGSQRQCVRSIHHPLVMPKANSIIPLSFIALLTSALRSLLLFCVCQTPVSINIYMGTFEKTTENG